MLALMLAGLALSPAPITALDSHVTRVTVYFDRAEIVREATVRVPRGSSQVAFEGIPIGVDTESIRVAARGVPARIGAIDLRQEVHDAEVPADFRGADADVKRIEHEIAARKAGDETDQSLRQYLDALRPTVAAIASSSAATSKPDPVAQTAMFAFLRDGYEGLAKRSLERRSESDALQEELRLARARRDAAKPRGAIQSRTAVVEIDADDAGSLHLELTYLTPGALWQPSYRASLDVATQTVELISEATVVQRTGEEWRDVELSLSTATPSHGLESPFLESWYLVPVQVAADISIGGGTSGQVGYRLNGMSTNDPVNGGPVLDMPAGAIENFKLITGGFNSEYGEQSSGVAAIVRRSEIRATYVISGKSDVPSDGAEHRVTLMRDTLAARLADRIVPSVEESAYKLALTTSPADRPLLEGTVRVVADGAYLGSFDMPETQPGTELRIPFGIDNRIRVRRVLLPATRGSQGASEKDRQVKHAFRTTIENLQSTPIELVVEERLPQSQDSRIAVKMGDETTEGSTEIEGRPGVINWKLVLGAKEKRELDLAYAVRWPKDLALQGM